MAIIIDKYDMKLAYKMAKDPSFNPCMANAGMAVATYGALVDILDQAACGASACGNLGAAWSFDDHFETVGNLLDEATTVVAEVDHHDFEDACGGGCHEIG